jgi:hypothetical protein
MTVQQNKTPVFAYVAWPLLLLIACFFVARVYHPSPAAFLVAGIVYLAGIIINIIQVQKSGDTTLLPYVIEAVGAVIFFIWCAA